MRLRSIVDKLHKPHKKNPRPPSPYQNKMSTENYDKTLISSPVTLKLLEEKNEKFVNDQAMLMNSMTKTINNIVQNNRELVERIVELTVENEKLKRSNAKLIMLVEMKEEDMGEHLDGLSVPETVAQLARL